MYCFTLSVILIKILNVNYNPIRSLTGVPREYYDKITHELNLNNFSERGSELFEEVFKEVKNILNKIEK